ncbi:MAG: hypothetical protein ACXAE3_05175 [Candidatus Kariarchaeaceae archaeon]|jgi:hypothetical protein
MALLSKHEFGRRSYNLSSFGRDIIQLARNRTTMREAHQQLDENFIRHIMLASTAVNQCKYCAWGHVLSGIRGDDDYQMMSAILENSFDGIPRSEIPALQFAILFAEKEGRVDRSDVKLLYQSYGEKTPLILSIVQMINFGNLSGNTIDAFEARLQGHRVSQGSPCLEFVLYTFAGTVFRRLMRGSELYYSMSKSGLL